MDFAEDKFYTQAFLKCHWPAVLGDRVSSLTETFRINATKGTETIRDDHVMT